MSLKAIDDLLVRTQQNEPVASVTEPQTPHVEPESAEPVADLQESEADSGESEERLTHLEKFRKDKEEYLAKQNESLSPDDQTSELNAEKGSDKAQDQQEIDDYGNKVPKSKVYTEEEVQAMIRKRLKLHHEEKAAQQPQQYQPPAQQYQQQDNFQHDETSELPWEVQLENHIKQTVQKIETEKHQLAWKAEQERAQVEFEHKFTSGMAKYQDFTDVVAGKPITNGIMMAARSMADPAAFIYAAAKQQPKELERIAQITDPYVLAAEVGRLEERMKKARNISRAPKPPTKTRGDIADKGFAKTNIDDLIRHDAKRKLGRR